MVRNMARKKLFPYPGAKTAVAKKLVEYFPPNYRDMLWLEAFGGSGIVTYHKPPSKMEVFNDLDEGISAIFYCLLFRFEEIGFRLEHFGQHSESILRWIQTPEHKEKQIDIVDKAISKIYQMCFSFGGLNDNIGYWIDPLHADRRKYTKMKLFDLNLWQMWRQRFHNVQIMNRPANDAVKLFDSSKMFVYCDPPYVEANRKSGLYELNFTDENHQELAKILSNIEGRFLLSYDDHPLIRELYADFYINEIWFTYNLQGRGLKRSKKTELLISNYPIKKQTKLDLFIPIGIEEMT